MFELAGIIILGIIAQWLSWRTRVPAILPLILIGLMIGPLSTLFTADGSKLIEPIYQQATSKGLFPPGASLFYFVSLAIGIILFEGGLTLKLKEVRDVGPAIVRLITVGSLITFLGAGMATHYIMSLPWDISFLFGALIIVTGPTVIAPILRNLPLNKNVTAVLKWEGILIDPIGALVAVLVFDFILLGGFEGESLAHTLILFARIIITGTALGIGSAYLIRFLIVKNQVPHYLLNVFSLAMVLLVFILSDVLATESGLLAVVVMGMTMANIHVPRINEILSFKESISILLISILFILLSANMDMEHLLLLTNPRCLMLFLLIVFVLRPLAVFMSTGNSSLETREKLFISWVGPRGIVAAGVASLFGLKLLEKNVPGAEYLTPLVFMVVLGTVLLNATTARFVAKKLKVNLEASDGVLIIGANLAARIIAKFLHDRGRHVELIDSNEESVNKALKMGLKASVGSIYQDDLSQNIDLLDVGYLLSLTSSQGINAYAVDRFREDFGENGTFRLLTSDEVNLVKDQLPAVAAFSRGVDFINLNELARDKPNIYSLVIKSKTHFDNLLSIVNKPHISVPLFLQKQNGTLEILPAHHETISVEIGDQIIYMGEELTGIKSPEEWNDEILA
ncbi:MAG: cation:proton antiporter [Saprospiraceae bacterium]